MIEYTSLIYNNNISKSYYWKFLIIIGAYYLMPSLQFLLFQSQNSDLCYYNHKCLHSYGIIRSFNNFISNIFYIIYGLIFIIQVKLKTEIMNDLSESEDIKSLYYCLGITLILEGISSGIYHICPSRLNFQFDTTFMIIGLLMAFLTLYNKRNHIHILNPFKFYLLVFFILILNVLSLNNNGNAIQLWFWGILFIFMTYIMLFGSIYIYFGNLYELNINNFRSLIKYIKSEEKDTRRLTLIVLLNSFNVGSCLFAALALPNFTGWILMVTSINLFIYFTYYIIIKICNGERILLVVGIGIVVDVIVLSTALYYFVHYPTNIFLTQKESATHNKDCILFGFFDNHDIWHILSSVGLYMFMNILLYIDYDLENTEKIDLSKPKTKGNTNSNTFNDF